VYALLQQRQRDLEFKSNVEERMAKLVTDWKM
jgi:hypothetical protein